MADENSILELRHRVSRFLYDDFRPDDLICILLAVRDLPYKGPAIQDIADFVAHRGERTKGTLSSGAQDFFTIIDFHVRLLRSGSGIDLNDMPASVLSVLNASYRALNRQTIRNRTGMNKRIADSTVDRIRSKLTKKEDGIFKLVGPDKDELSLFEICISIISTNYIYEKKHIINELWLSLYNNNVVNLDEKSKFISKTNIVMLFSLTKMHGKLISISNNSKAKLILSSVTSGESEPNLILSALYTLDYPLETPIRIARTMIETDLVLSDWCHPDCRFNRDFTKELDFTGPLEICKDGYIIPLGSNYFRSRNR